jgi:CelD/BcsL family acetyltransferase involved in cellulose biosynthesis
VDRWRDLAARALEPNPFMEADFVVPAARFLGDEPRLLTVSDGEDLRACVAVVRVPRWRGVPWPALVTWRHDYCFLGSPLVDRVHSVDALRALIEVASPRVLVLEWLRTGGAVWDTLSAVLADQATPPVSYETFQRPMAHRIQGAFTVDASARRRRRLGELRTWMGDELDGEVEVTQRAGDRRALEQFLALEARGWKGRAGTALALRPGHAEFMRDMCGRFAAAGRLHLESLEVDGEPVAMVCGLVAGPGVFWFKTAYDERYSRASPGVQVLIESVEHLERRDTVCWIDTCAAPSAGWLAQLIPGRTTVSSVVVPPAGLVGRSLGAGTRRFVAARDRRRERRADDER